MQQTPQFIIYNASAGSGKTFTLVKNYIADLLLGKRGFRNILAITFTNKAVAEMKQRIVETLKGISTIPLAKEHHPMFEQLQKQTGLPKEEIQHKARVLLTTILHNYAAFEISTIDSFTHRILQVFAKDLHIPTHFEVQLEQEEILQEAVDLVLSKAGTDQELTQTLIEFALSKADQDKSWDITKDLNEIAKLILNENNFAPLAQLRHVSLKDFEELQTQLREKNNTAQKEQETAGHDFFKLLDAHHLSEGDFKKAVIGFFSDLAHGKWKKPSTAKWAQYPEQNPPYNKGLDASKKAIIDSLSPQISDLYQRAEQAYYRVDFHQQILKKLSSTSLLSAIEKEVDQLKTERGLLMISEFNQKISKQIKNEPAPFIYERLGERFNAFYIDEFQDTSVLQWENLKPLISESLSKEAGQLTLIGDAKQSIYRWRGGKAKQFMALSAEKNPFFTKKQIEHLPENYRSSSDIVQFNNAFFTYSAGHLQTEAYRTLFEKSAQRPALQKQGLVDLRFLPAANKEEANESYPKEVLAILTELKAKYPAGYPLYKEVCILVRHKKEGYAIADFLTQNNIPIISAESLLLKNSPTVNFLLNLIQYATRPKDKSLKFELLNYLYPQVISSSTEFQFIHPKLHLEGAAFFEALTPEGFSFDLATFERLPFYDAIAYSLRQFKLTDQADAYVQFFLDFVYEYTQRHTGGMAGFLDLWELKKDKLTIVLPEGNDAVQIMTIHKAKGLEFPIVIFPYADSEIYDTRKDNLWIPMGKEHKIPYVNTSVKKDFVHYGAVPSQLYSQLLLEKEMDAINLLYVALTRPKDQLYILSSREEKAREKMETFSDWFIAFLKHKNLWNPEQHRYVFGQLPPPKTHEEQTGPTPSVPTFICSAPQDHNIYMVTRSGQEWGSAKERAQLWGNLVHQLLKSIHTAADIAPTLEEATRLGTLAQYEKKSLQRLIEAVVEHPQLQPYFTPQYQSYTEKEILIQNQYKRLDRLCLKDKQAVIIDYKTGTYHPSHALQVNAYANAIQAFGYSIKEKLLVYINTEINVKRVE